MSKDSVKASSNIASAELARVGERRRGIEDVQNYLRQFGYMRKDVELKSGEVDDKTSEALRAFQAFNGLPKTGEFDSATKEMMTKPRCGLPDMDNGVAFTLQCRWDRQQFTYAFGNGTADIGGAEFQAVRDAFATWASIVPVIFTEVNANSNPDILIDWRNANDPDYGMVVPGSMVGSIIAHADYPPPCPFINSALPRPVHFDDSEETWSIGAVLNAHDVQSVALHEIGHILGLYHSTISSAVMWKNNNTNSTLRTLQPDDIAAIRSLYGWSPQMRLQDRGTLTSPALAAFGGRVIMAWRGTDADQGIWWSFYDGANWSRQMRLQDRGTATSPALGAFGNNRLIMAWRGTDGDQGIWWSFYDGANWSGQTRLQDRGTATSPALSGLWNGLVIMAWRGTDDQGIWWSSYDGANWSGQTRLQDRGTATSPALAVYDDLLPLPLVIKAWRGTDADQGIWMSYYNTTVLADGTTSAPRWSPQMRLQDRGTRTSPALAAYGRGVIKAWRGTDDDQGIWWSRLDLRT